MRSLQTLLESWSGELSARANRIRLLIGDAHWLSDGMHKEQILEDFIATRLPDGMGTGHGFLLDLRADLCSNEIDLFVRNRVHCAPLLDESE